MEEWLSPSISAASAGIHAVQISAILYNTPSLIAVEAVASCAEKQKIIIHQSNVQQNQKIEFWYNFLDCMQKTFFLHIGMFLLYTCFLKK